MFKVVSIPTPNVFQEPMDMVGWVDELKALKMLVVTQAAELKGVRALLATVAENTVNTQEAVLAARVEAQEKQIEGLTQWKEEALRAQLALRTHVSTLDTQLGVSCAEVTELKSQNGMLQSQVAHLGEELVRTRALIPEIAVLTGALKSSIRHVPTPVGFSPEECQFFNIQFSADGLSLGGGRTAYLQRSRAVLEDTLPSYEMNPHREINNKDHRGAYFVIGVRYPHAADERTEEPAASATGE